MKPIATPASADVFAKLMHLPTMEQYWVLLHYWQSLDSAQEARLQEFPADALTPPSDLGGGPYENAKERLLEDPDLSAREKVLLAALMLSELHEIQEFHGRQVTETLRDSSNPVNNITAALTGLIGRGEAEISEQGPAGKNAHKRYRLTQESMIAARDITRRKQKRRVLS